jgi:excisionase family DNA binding protein
MTTLLTIEEAAERLAFSKSYLYQLISAGKIKHVKFPNAVRIREEDLEAWIAERLVPVGGRSPKPRKSKGEAE